MMVSVVVATYRRDEALKNALASLKEQTLKDMEILVADDNADHAWNEKVEKICAEFGARHVVNEENLGSARNRNRAASMAQGKYIAFLDDDDVYLPEKLEKQLAAIEKADADVCIEDLRLVDEEGKTVETRVRDYLVGADPRSYLRLHLVHHMSGTDTVMFRREAFDRIGGFPPINLGDEFYLMAKALTEGLKLCYHPEIGALGTVHKTGGLSSGDSKIKCETDLYEYKKPFMLGLPGRDRRYIRMRHYAVLAFAYLRMRDMGAFVKNAALSFVCAPISCARFFVKKLSERSS